MCGEDAASLGWLFLLIYLGKAAGCSGNVNLLVTMGLDREFF